MRNRISSLVYSTETAVPRKEPVKKTDGQSSPPSRQNVIVRLERKGRGGKAVTVVEGLQMRAAEKDALLKQLKSRFGTGGALKDEILEIQGDHRDAILLHLQGLGFRPKKSGG